jgi:hypothetical protein
MKESLRNFLRDRCGLSEDDIAKIARGESPDKDGSLRKSADEHPGYAAMREAGSLLKAIKSDLASIHKADANRVAAAEGAALWAGKKMNGHAGVNALAALAEKGITQ